MTISDAIKNCIKEYENIKAEDPNKIFLAGYLHGLNCVMDFEETPERERLKDKIDQIQYRLDYEVLNETL